MNFVKLLSDMLPSESKQELVAGITSWLNSYSEIQQTVYDIKATQSENLRLLQELQSRFDMETHYNDVDSTVADVTDTTPSTETETDKETG